VKQENVVVLWVVLGFVLALVVLDTGQPWWYVPAGMFAAIALSPLYVR
jgi:hypothetical protein